jgi:uncharacterized repeat protein (TIGR01451 family)
MMNKNGRLIGLALVILLAGSAQLALATGTPSGTTIGNTATVDFTVGGINQAQVASNTANFLVDNRIDLTVANLDGGTVNVVPGATGMFLTYAVSNTGNTTQDYALSALADAADDFDALTLAIFADVNGNGTYEPATDTATYIDELAMDTIRNVFVVGDIPLAAGDAQVANYDLLVRSANGGVGGSLGTVIAADDAGVADDPNAVEVVFADAAGPSDAVLDGQFSATDQYLVVSAALAVVKASAVASDPINGAANPKAIPGAVMDYTLDVTNTGSADADNVVVADAIPANTAFVVASVTAPGTAVVAYSADGGTTWAYGPADVGDGSDPAVTHVRIDFGTVAGAATTQAVFQVLIQ